MKQYYLIVFLLIAFGCSRNTVPDNIQLGEFLTLSADGPVFVLSSAATFDADNQSKLFVNIELFKSNLIFKTTEQEGYHAKIEINYSVFKFDGLSRNRIFNEYKIKIIEGNSDLIEQGFERLRFGEIFDIEPGEYEIEVKITDMVSNVSKTKKTSSILPDLSGGIVASSEIIVNGIASSEVSQLIGTYDIPSSYDELRFSFFVSNPDDDKPIYVVMQLHKIEKDSSPARFLTAPNLPASSLTRRGIDYRNMELIESQVRRLEPGMNSVEIDYQTEMPISGAYRFEVQLSTVENPAQNSDILSTKARDFAIRTLTFPDIGSSREMAEPLIYLMNASDYQDMMKIEDDALLLREVEKFWISNLGTASKARDIMNLYYQRVVEANMQFTTFKEGWKTDMGMIYILFGRPWYVDVENDRITWTYGYDRRDPLRTFVYFRTRIDTDRFPFDYWVVRRSINYHNTMYQQVQDWLSGYVMGRNFPY